MTSTDPAPGRGPREPDEAPPPPDDTSAGDALSGNTAGALPDDTADAPPGNTADAPPGNTADAPPDDTADDATLLPPVVVTVVAQDPGEWFEESLASLAAQDYPNLSVLVIAGSGDEDLVARVAAVLPSAYVRRVEGNPGFTGAANEVLEVVEGAALYCFCHDDVALEPDAVRHLVDEALRSNAGVVGPKIVDWADPDRLLDVGLAVDKAGVVAPLVDRGELDQEQHDAIRDVFAVPSACVLVRADLFRAIGGFDPIITELGDDVDLCWRAQIAGARVVVVPDARVRHRSRPEERHEELEGVRLRTRHRIRTVLTCYSRFHLLRVLPQAMLLTVAEAALAIATGRVREAREHAAAWTWNLSRLPEIRERRRALKEVRVLPDSEVRKLQAHGSVRFSSFVRGELGQAEQLRESLTGVGRGITGSFTAGPQRLVLAAWILAAFVVVIGCRDLIARGIPLLAGFAPVHRGPLLLLRDYLSGWHFAGVGAETPVPTAVALLGLGGLPLLGARGVLQLLLVVGMLPLGAVGAWRLTKPLGTHRSRAAGLALYVANPLPYDALARGAWGGLLLYGATPWLLAGLFRDAGDEPFAPQPDRLRRWVSYGLVLALLTAFVPVAALLFVVVAAAVALGSAVTGWFRRSLGALGTAVAGAGVAAVLHLPWTFDFVLPGADWWSTGGVSPMATDRVSLGDLLRFQLGSVGIPLLGWAIPLAAVLPLVIGQGWRFRWAVRAWAVTLACVALAWTAGNGKLALELPSAHVLLAPAAAALAFAAALGILAFEVDLRGYRFGARQVASLVTAGLAVAAVVPVIVASVDGRWQAPRVDFGRTLAFLDDDGGVGGFRTLWIGDPEVLPLAGHRLDDDLAFALSDGGTPDVVDRIATSPTSGTELVADALRLVADGRSDRLGRLLAPFGIRYVAVLSSSAPARSKRIDRPLPEGLQATLAGQLDLRRIDADPAIDLFESTAWMPVRALVRGPGIAAVEQGRLFATAAATDFSAAEPAVGPIGAGTVYLATPFSSGWHLRVDGHDARRAKALGWANRFEVTSAGTATLRFETDPSRYLAVLAQAVLWVIAGRVALRRRRPAEDDA